MRGNEGSHNNTLHRNAIIISMKFLIIMKRNWQRLISFNLNILSIHKIVHLIMNKLKTSLLSIYLPISFFNPNCFCCFYLFIQSHTHVLLLLYIRKNKLRICKKTIKVYIFRS